MTKFQRYGDKNLNVELYCAMQIEV